MPRFDGRRLVDLYLEHAGPLRPAERAWLMKQQLTSMSASRRQPRIAAWPDTALPALGGRTPREAAGSSRHRAKLDVLLKELENHEARQPEGERFDMAMLRTELGMGARPAR
ncbi:MAG: hypothetical protein ACRELB_09305 [Polyangiaceae bacterium]